MSDEDTAKLNSSLINTEYEVLLMHNNRIEVFKIK